MALVTDAHVAIYQNQIKQVRHDLGRTATIYLRPTQTECEWCILDRVNNRSTGVQAPNKDWEEHTDYVSPKNDRICPECSGKGYTEVENTVTALGTKKDLSYNDREDLVAGVFKPGTIRLSFILEDVLVDTSDLEGDTWLDRSIKVNFDGEDYEVVNLVKSGLRDLYTCRVILERTNK